MHGVPSKSEGEPPVLTPQTYEEIKTALMEANALAAAIKEMEVMHAEEVAEAVAAIQKEKRNFQTAQKVIKQQREEIQRQTFVLQKEISRAVAEKSNEMEEALFALQMNHDQSNSLREHESQAQLEQVRSECTAKLQQQEKAHATAIESAVSAMEDAGTALAESQTALAEKEVIHTAQVREAVKTAVARALKDRHIAHEEKLHKTAQAALDAELASKDEEYQLELQTVLAAKEKVHAAALHLALQAKEAEHGTKLEEVVKAKEQEHVLQSSLLQSALQAKDDEHHMRSSETESMIEELRSTHQKTLIDALETKAKDHQLALEAKEEEHMVRLAELQHALSVNESEHAVELSALLSTHSRREQDLEQAIRENEKLHQRAMVELTQTKNKEHQAAITVMERNFLSLVETKDRDYQQVVAEKLELQRVAKAVAGEWSRLTQMQKSPSRTPN